MELQLAKYVSNLLTLLFRSLYVDMESFFSCVQYFLQFFPMIFSTKWNHFRRISTTCEKPPIHQNPCNIHDQGRISIAEANMVMNRLGMATCRIDEGGAQDDLVSLFEEEEPSLEEIKETFKVFDANNDGFVDASELHRVVCSLGLKERYELEDCNKMVIAFDGNGDGVIDFHEFVKFMEKCLC